MKFLREWKTRMQTLRDEDRRRPALSDSPRPLVFGGGSVVEGPVVEFADVQLVSPDGRHLISDPLNFKVPKGKNIMLTGPNGCGKSSLCAPRPRSFGNQPFPLTRLGCKPLFHIQTRGLSPFLTHLSCAGSACWVSCGRRTPA